MTYYITHLKDTIGNNYLGIKIPISHILPFLKTLNEYIGEDDYVKYTELQQKRDHGEYHINYPKIWVLISL